MDHISDPKIGQSTGRKAGILTIFITADNRCVYSYWLLVSSGSFKLSQEWTTFHYYQQLRTLLIVFISSVKLEDHLVYKFCCWKVTGYQNHCSEQSRQNNSQLLCVRLQLQNIEDESRGTTQTCIVRSGKLSQSSCHVHVVKLKNFPAKFHFNKQLGWTNGNTHKQFVTFLRVWQRLLESTSRSLRNNLFSAKFPCTT